MADALEVQSIETGSTRVWEPQTKLTPYSISISLQDVDAAGVPNWGYVDMLPSMITLQGQNRAAITISALANKFGLPKHRGGRHGEINLFEGDGELNSPTSDSPYFFLSTVCNNDS